MTHIKIQPAEGYGAHIRSVNALSDHVDTLGTGSLIEGADPDGVGWVDLLGEFGAAKGTPTTTPTWDDIGNNQYAYRFTAGDELFVKYHIPHSYKLGSLAYPHVHFIVDQTMTVGQTLVWSFNYVIAKGHNQNQSLSGVESTIVLTYTATGNEVAGEHIILEGTTEAEGIDLVEVDALLCARVKLDSENVVGNVYGLMADMHMLSDRVATLNKAPNFYA